MPSTAGGRTPPLPTQSLFHLWGIPLDLSVNRGMVNANAAFSHHLLKVAIADAVSAVPTNCPQYDFTTEMTAFESTHVITKPILNDNSFAATHDFTTELPVMLDMITEQTMSN